MNIVHSKMEKFT